jgi:hypothetical protein
MSNISIKLDDQGTMQSDSAKEHPQRQVCIRTHTHKPLNCNQNQQIFLPTIRVMGNRHLLLGVQPLPILPDRVQIDSPLTSTKIKHTKYHLSGPKAILKDQNHPSICIELIHTVYPRSYSFNSILPLAGPQEDIKNTAESKQFQSHSAFTTNHRAIRRASNSCITFRPRSIMPSSDQTLTA